MERSRKTFRKIAAASQRVVTVANDYADRVDCSGVPRCHHQLEEDMQRISVACACIADVLDKLPPEQGSAIDVRIQDWLDTDGPQECLQTLSRMESVLQPEQDSSWMSRMFGRGRGPTTTRYKIRDAVDLFNSSKGCFHFLFSTEIWNNEKAIREQHPAPHLGDHAVQDGPDPPQIMVPTVAQMGLNLLSDLDAPQRGHIVAQSFSADTQTSITVQEAARDQERYVAMQNRRNVKGSIWGEEEDKRFKEVLMWLDGLNCAEKQDVTLSLHRQDTCEWLFDTTQYRTWRDTENGFLWLRGKPGSGKSVLVSFVIDSFKRTRREGEILTFFYCEFRNERSTSPAEAMRSILSQLLRQLRRHSIDLRAALDDLIEAKEWGGATLSNAMQLAGITSRAAGLLSRKPLVIVDALDECKDAQKLIQALMMIRDHVRLFVSSRPLHFIVDALSGLPFVSLEDMADKVSEDIKLHVVRELDVRPRLRDLDSPFKMDIRLALCEKADGMFRWVQCSIDTLDRCVTRKEVRYALNTLPKGLDETYERILLAIHTETMAGKLAQRALTWLVAAQRTLSLSEIMEALSINLKTRALDSEIGPMHRGALLDACGSLVTYSEKTGVITLAHFSVKEYLVGRFMRTKLPGYHVNLERAHLLLARSCMCYISICLEHAQRSAPTDTPVSFNAEVSSQPWIRLHPKSHPLLDYTLDDALDHFGHLRSKFKLALHDVAVLAKDIQRHSWIWDHVCIPGRWEMSSKPHWPAAVHDLLLYVLVAFASDSFMRAFLRRTALKSRTGTNPLVYAAYFNKVEHARTLLSLGAELNQRGWETLGCRQSLPIEVALWSRHYTLVTLFVEEGSSVPPHIFTEPFFSSTGYSMFSTIPSPIASLLFQTDDFVESIIEYLNVTASDAFKSANHLLVFRNIVEQDFIAVIRRFIQAADENLAPNLIKEAFFCFAVAKGYFFAAQYLCTLDTPLPSDILVRLCHYPGRWKNVPMIRFLLHRGAKALAYTSAGDSVLHVILWAPGRDRYPASYDVDASEDDILEAVKLLVELGCKPLEADSHGETPLRIAVERGYISVAQHLLSFDETFPSDSFLTLTNWHSASMICLLVKNGANPLVHTADGDSLLHIALQSQYDDTVALEMVKVLVYYGCNPREANPYGKTPAHIAVEQGHVSVARYLVSIGASLPRDLLVTLSLRKSDYGAPMTMIRFLVDNDVDLLARTSDGDSMLHIVSEFYKEEEALEAMKFLVSHGCDPFVLDAWGKTPLHIAAKHGHISVARYLISLGPDTALYNKSRMRPHMIRLLVENGVNVLVRSTNLAELVFRSTALHSDDEAVDVVKLLVGYGCDPLEATPSGNTLLLTAVKEGYTSVARYLLTTLGIHPPHDLFTTLSHLTWRRDTASIMIPLLVEHGVDVSGESVLHNMLFAIKTNAGAGALETARILVDYGCEFLEANRHGKTPLQLAVENGHISVAQYLISAGAPLPLDFLTTLYYPAWFGCASRMISFLVEKGVDVLAHTDDGSSILHIVLEWPYSDDDALEMVTVLVNHGCNPSEANARGKTPLHIAVEKGNINMAHNLTLLGASVPSDLLVTLSKSLEWLICGTHMISFLVEHGVNLLERDSDGNSVLHVVLELLAGSNDVALDVARDLVARRCDPFQSNALGKTPLHIAVEQGHIAVSQYFVSLGAPLPRDLLVTLDREGSCWATASMVRFLVRMGVDVFAHTDDGDSVLHMALWCFNNDGDILEVVEFLINTFGCNPLEANSHGNTPLHIAVARGRVSVARYLLALDNSPSLPSDLLVTLNLDRPRWCTIRMIRFLIENGINVLAHASNRDPVLHNALRCPSSELEAVELLVNYGCDPLEANSRGEVPLHIAAMRSHISIARYLITQRANVLTKASNGDTVLHFATSGVYPYPYDDEYADDHTLEASKFFVGKGSHPTITNDYGVTPLHNAVELGRVKTINYFLSLNKSLPHDILFTAIRSDKNTSCCRYIVKALVTSGCDTRSTNSEGDVPLQAAIKKGKVDVVKYLLSEESVQKPPLEDLLSAVALAPPSVQSEMRRTVSDSRVRSESPELPPAKRAKHS